MRCPICKMKFSFLDKFKLLGTKNCKITCQKCKNIFTQDLKIITVISVAIGTFASGIITINMQSNFVSLIIKLLLSIVIIFTLILILIEFKKLNKY